MWKSAFTEKLDIAFPIIQAPMAGGATTPELIAVVCNAGGLGFLGAGYMTSAEIKLAIKKIRLLTSKPFGVNLFIPEEYSVTKEQMYKACEDINACCRELGMKLDPISPPYAPSFEEQVLLLIEEKIPVFSFTFGLLNQELIKAFKKNKTLLIGTATTLEEAKLLEENKIDMIVVQGREAGGHRGTFLGKAENALISLKTLLPECIANIKKPIIASGGIMNGKDIRNMLSWGAAAVQMGTTFLSCHEAGISEAYKKMLCSQQKDNTVLTRVFSGKMARGINNYFIEKMTDKNITILDYPVQNALTKLMRKKANENNNTDFMSLWAGQGAALCRNISASELIKMLIHEADAK